MDTKGLRKILQAIQEFRKLNPEMPAQMMLTFVLVAIRGQMPMKELAAELGLSQGSVSRNVAALSEEHRLGKPGAGLLEAEVDPAERRRKNVRLTAKGRAVAATLIFIAGEN